MTRMDDQQHATSALLRTTAIVELDAVAPGHDAPSAWLWALALVALLNPLLVGMAVPTRPRRADRATLAAVGAAIGAVIVVVAALVAEPLFDALDVSRPAARLAVGLVAASRPSPACSSRPPAHRTASPAGAPRSVPVAIPTDGVAGARAARARRPAPTSVPCSSPACWRSGLDW